MGTLNQDIPFFDLKRQYEPLYEELEQGFRSFLRSGKFILGPDVSLLEEALADFLGVQHAVGVSSGTDALILSLRAAGIKAGDHVLTTPFTFFATVSAILAVGATPVFADIDETTYNLDPHEAEKILAEDRDRKIRAVLAVHLYGQPAEMDTLLSLSQKYQIPLIEDAAQAIGSEYKGKKTGSLGTLGAFSFYPTKNLGAMGDAGLVTTQDKHLNETVRMLRAHGSKQIYVHEKVGGNFRMDTVQALFLRTALPHLDSWNKRRQVLASKYNEAFVGISDLLVGPVPAPHTVHGFHQYTVRIKKGLRDAFKSYLSENKIGSCVYYPIPCHKQKALETRIAPHLSLPKSEIASEEVLSLPIFPGLSNPEQERVIDTILKWVRQNA